MHVNNLANNADTRFSAYQKSYNNYLSLVKKTAIKTSKINLLYECLGTFNTMLILAIGMLQFEKDTIDYRTVLILVISSYLISALTPKICDAIFFVNEGAKSIRQFNRTVSNSK